MTSTGLQLTDALSSAIDDEVAARNLARQKPRATRSSIIREAVAAHLASRLAASMTGTIGGTR